MAEHPWGDTYYRSIFWPSPNLLLKKWKGGQKSWTNNEASCETDWWLLAILNPILFFICRLCRFLPNCKAGDSCPFLHPVCKNYPSCRYGPACKYKHPGLPTNNAAATTGGAGLSSVMCKFDMACAKPNCPYKHTNPKKLVNPGENLRILCGC